MYWTGLIDLPTYSSIELTQVLKRNHDLLTYSSIEIYSTIEGHWWIYSLTQVFKGIDGFYIDTLVLRTKTALLFKINGICIWGFKSSIGELLRRKNYK